MGHRMGVLEVCSAEGIRRGSIGDPQGILGGSSQFSGDPTFFDKQIHWVYCIFKGDPVRPLAARLKRCCEQVNQELDVDDLCRAFPKRCKKLDEAQGGRLGH